MPRGRRKKSAVTKFKISPEVAKSILALTLIVLAGICLVSFFAPDQLLNAKIQNLLNNYFGGAAFLVPVILAFLGILLIDALEFKYKKPMVLLGGVVLLFVLAATFGLSSSGAGDLPGGMIGAKLSQMLVSSISVYGAMLVLLAGFMLALTFIFDLTLSQIFQFLGKFLEVFAKFKDIKLPAVSLRRPASKQDDIVISSGQAMSDGDYNDFQSTEPEIETRSEEKPDFEIIPSPAEPQNVSVQSDGHDLAKETLVSSIVPSLPYTDKVWELPPIDLLHDAGNVVPDSGDVQARAKIIAATLKSFGIAVNVVDIQKGPSVTQYSLEAEIGTKISKIAALQYDLALALASPTGSVRIEAPIPGKSLIGIEVPNTNTALVSFKSLLVSDQMKALKSKLGIVLGKDVAGQARVYDITRMPHLLIAGSTGSGKSVFLHSILFSILFRASPQEVKFIMIDPKRVEMVHYHDIPHLYAQVVTDIEKAPAVFRWAVLEMDRRYKLFESAKVRNIEGYNEKSGFQALPYIIIVVDELAEIMIADPAGVEKSIVRIAQLARATGIHLILATQRPSTNVISGLIKANIPSRISFSVTSQIDSRVIIDQPGAEKLLGKGDMLFVPPDVQKPIRIQGAYLSDKEISNLVNYLKNTGVKPDYREDIFNAADKNEKNVSSGGEGVDELFNEAVDIVTASGKASASLLQRRLSIGYARAARILDELEHKGIISTANGSKPREVLGSAGSSYGNSGGGYAGGRGVAASGMAVSNEYYEPGQS